MSNDLVPHTILSEIASIEGEMGTRSYWKDEGKQARYRQLVSHKATFSGPAETILDGAVVDIASRQEYAAETGTTDGYDRYVRVSMAAADVVLGMPSAEHREFIASFESLPDEVAGAAVLELVESKPAVEWSSDEAVGNFSRLPEGAVLVSEWRDDARRNLAVVRERLFRIIDRIEEEDVGPFVDWLNSLSVPAAVSLYRKLAA